MGFAGALTFACAAMIEAKLDQVWARWTRPTETAATGRRDVTYCSRGDDRGLFDTAVLWERVVSAATQTSRTQQRRRRNVGSVCSW
jgi:hypothetical protein